MKKISVILAVIAVTVIAVAAVYAASDIRNTKHNLASWGPGTYKSTNYNEVCVFCHTPHAAVGEPLWNRTYTTPTFTVYSSTTFNARITSQTFSIDATSTLCFSCHEAVGTVKTNLPNPSNLKNNAQPTWGFGGINPTAALGTNLRDDHPVGFNYASLAGFSEVYTTAQAAANIGDTEAVLFPNGIMTCASCHDVHGKLSGTVVIPVLLQRSNTSSMLCLSCHNK